MSNDETHEYLVGTEWLAENLARPGVRVVEVDEDPSAYQSPGHIPGAVQWDWQADLHHPTRRDFLDVDALKVLLTRTGVGSGDVVVLYGGNSNWFAAYALWLLELRGFRGARLLDGGKVKWEAEGRPLETVVPAPEAPTTPVTLGPEQPEIRARRDFVLEQLEDAAFVDVRSPGEFDGSVLAPPHLPQEQPYVGGHVPGAFNVPWGSAVAEDGTFLPVPRLREVYRPVIEAAAAGPIIAYCRIGERAAHTWFALSKLLGAPDVRNYDGSGTEYGSLVDVPVERGEGGRAS